MSKNLTKRSSLEKITIIQDNLFKPIVVFIQSKDKNKTDFYRAWINCSLLLCCYCRALIFVLFVFWSFFLSLLLTILTAVILFSPIKTPPNSGIYFLSGSLCPTQNSFLITQEQDVCGHVLYTDAYCPEDCYQSNKVMHFMMTAVSLSCTRGRLNVLYRAILLEEEE